MASVSTPTIEGASPEQRQLLHEILSGLGGPAPSRIVVRPHEPRYEDDTVPRLPEPHGDAVVLDFAPEGRRADWEATLLAFAFARRSSAAGLPKVAWCEWPDRGFMLELAKPSIEPLSGEAIDCFRAAVVAAAGDARLERLDVLRPDGHAFALVLRVDEPHAWLRFRSRAFLWAAEQWRGRSDGIYIEMCDTEPAPVLRVGWHRMGGFSGSRRDVECCAPILGFGRPIGAPPRPPCPVFG
jgi:hypothetical protein